MKNKIIKEKTIKQKKEHGNIDSSLEYFLRLNIPKNAKILDIGCNYGSLIYNLYKKGYKNVYGIDINKKTIKEGKKYYKEIRSKIKIYNGKKIPYQDQSFDVVLMFDVIEHIPNIENFLKGQVYKILKKKGIFVFQTPNKIINIPWEIINQRSLTKWKKYHCSLQIKRGLLKKLRNSGFKEIIIEKYDILTEHNKNKIKRKMGFLGLPVLDILQKMPLFLYPNLWGVAVK
jgi:2-polyprenyl-3-methyl-5-hydroxy-6-metoxy-1,4-benzoquinol methylase